MGRVSGRSDLTVVVHGLPGSGKSTLGSALAEAMRAEFLSFDRLKEELFESSEGTLEGVDLRMAAEGELGERLAATTGPAVVDIWVQPGRDDERVVELLRRTCSQVAEVICRVPANLAVERYVARIRSGPHKPADPETLLRIRAAAVELAPLGLGPCFEVDTSTPVDPLRLASEIDAPRAGSDQIRD